ncbi:MAG: hypothetical protein ACRD11_07755 [Terriglobia bacterium]
MIFLRETLQHLCGAGVVLVHKNHRAPSERLRASPLRDHNDGFINEAVAQDQTEQGNFVGRYPPSASAIPRRVAAHSARLREYAIAISTSAAFGVTLPMSPFG